MRKLAFICFFSILMSFNSNSQPTLTVSSAPVPWDFFVFHPADSASAQPGSGGANQTWDFSQVKAKWNPQTINYLPTQSTGYDTAFPTATAAIEDVFVPGEYIFIKKGTNDLVGLGSASSFKILKYSNPITMLTYPFTYNSVINDTYSGTAKVSTLEFKKNGTYQVTGDGYGTLILPAGTHTNVLRVKTVNDYTEEWVGSTKYTYNVVEYNWYLPSKKQPLVMIRSIDSKIDTASQPKLKLILVSAFAAGISSQEVIDDELTIYPNPSNSTTEISIQIKDKTDLKLELFNPMGQLIYVSLNKNITSGKYKKTLDLSGIPSGYYIVRIVQNGQVAVKPLIIN